MTENQWMKLKEGDVVTRTNGPNKDIPLSVTAKLKGISGTKFVCAEIIDYEKLMYDPYTNKRDKTKIFAAASKFKLIEEKENKS